MDQSTLTIRTRSSDNNVKVSPKYAKIDTVDQSKQIVHEAPIKIKHGNLNLTIKLNIFFIPDITVFGIGISQTPSQTTP